MQLTRSIRSTFVALVGASVLAASASAGGEPKNEWPFTRPVGPRVTQAAAAAAAAAPSRSTAPPAQGEPKNEAPFTRPATVVIQTSDGFDWTAAAIGLVAGLGVAATGAGFMTLAHRSPQTA